MIAGSPDRLRFSGPEAAEASSRECNFVVSSFAAANAVVAIGAKLAISAVMAALPIVSRGSEENPTHPPSLTSTVAPLSGQGAGGQEEKEGGGGWTGIEERMLARWILEVRKGSTAV